MPDTAAKLMPYLLYEDADRAVDWLVAACGYLDAERQRGSDGRTSHAELRFGTQQILLGCPGPQYRNPRHVGSLTQYLYLLVDDVQSVFERAVQAGAAVVEKPADQPYGHRRCAVDDPEGHRWYFAQPIGAPATTSVSGRSSQGGGAGA